MAEWQKCPICNGVGQVSGGFFARAGDCNFWASSGGIETCRPCGGKGMVIAPAESAGGFESFVKNVMGW